MDSSDNKTNGEIDQIITVNDLLAADIEDQERFGGLNDEVCTYDEGYTRQELFSCLTCFEETKQLAGICYACSNVCHENHELVELYTRRQFTCDCGNEKFKQECQLQNDKKRVNEYNKYTDNFKNQWCSCKLPYPPPEGTPEFDSEMLQCVVCEDWFHSIHLDNYEEGEFEEVVCKSCVTKLPFLLAYDDYSLPADAATSTECRLAPRRELTTQEPRTLYFTSSKAFRESLCQCAECSKLYFDKECEFLTDYSESAVKYNIDRDARASQDGSTAIEQISNQLKRKYGDDVSVEVSRSINGFVAVMQDEFNSAVARGEVITHDIVKRIIDRTKEFTAKRRRLDDDVKDADL